MTNAPQSNILPTLNLLILSGCELVPLFHDVLDDYIVHPSSSIILVGTLIYLRWFDRSLFLDYIRHAPDVYVFFLPSFSDSF